MNKYKYFAGCRIAVFLSLAGATTAMGGFLTNGSFTDFGGVTSSFSIGLDHALPGWSLSGPATGNKILDCAVVNTDTNNLCGTAFGGNFKFWTSPGASPDGGNFVAIDGDQGYANALQQTVTGLTVGQFYTLTFYQAAAQQSGFNGNTTEQWQVTFGATSLTSTLMNNLSHGAVAWNKQTMVFQAGQTSQLLTFLALGTPNGVPPFVLLDGVSLSAPEPQTLALVGLGLIALPLASMRRKKNK